MRFRMKPEHADTTHDLKLERQSFAIFVEEGLDDDGTWYAKIVGDKMDWMAYADHPLCAVYMAFDLLRSMTSLCIKSEAPSSDSIRPEHDWSVETVMDPRCNDAECWQICSRAAVECSWCGVRAPREHFEEVTDDDEADDR